MIQGLRIGVNGREAKVGQVFANLNATISASGFERNDADCGAIEAVVWIGRRRSGDDGRRPVPPAAVVRPQRVLDALQAQVRDHPGQVRGTDDRPADPGDRRVLQAHREGGNAGQPIEMYAVGGGDEAGEMQLDRDCEHDQQDRLDRHRKHVFRGDAASAR